MHVAIDIVILHIIHYGVTVKKPNTCDWINPPGVYVHTKLKSISELAIHAVFILASTNWSAF